MTPPMPAGLADHPNVVLKMWPSAAQSVGTVRQLLPENLLAWGLPELADSAELVVSELVTNAVTHAHPPYGNPDLDAIRAAGVGRSDRGARFQLAHTVAPALTWARRDWAEHVAAMAAVPG